MLSIRASELTNLHVLQYLVKKKKRWLLVGTCGKRKWSNWFRSVPMYRILIGTWNPFNVCWSKGWAIIRVSRDRCLICGLQSISTEMQWARVAWLQNLGLGFLGLSPTRHLLIIWPWAGYNLICQMADEYVDNIICRRELIWGLNESKHIPPPHNTHTCVCVLTCSSETSLNFITATDALLALHKVSDDKKPSLPPLSPAHFWFKRPSKPELDAPYV